MISPSASFTTSPPASVGLLIDRCLRREQPLGTVWLIDANRAVTCAHLLVLYSDYLNALKVSFSAGHQDWSISKAIFHPQFKHKQALQMAKRALSSPVPALALQDKNLVVLQLTPGVNTLETDYVTSVNEHLALPAPAKNKGLAGNLAELDLPLVIQTITNARKEGILVILDERNHPTARLFCRDGKILYASFEHLSGEKALYQMFSQRIAGNFQFRTAKEPDWEVSKPIQRPADMLLIESLRRVDEIPKLLLDLGGDTTIYRPTLPQPNIQQLSVEARSAAEDIWPFLSNMVPLGQMWRVSGLDDYSIFSSLVELWRNRQIEEVPLNHAENSYQTKPLEIAPELPLAPWDNISSLTVDTISGRIHSQAGHLLGLLRPEDPWHLIHDLNLPNEGAGSPLLKDGKVIGIHLGHLPADPSTSFRNLNQLLWIEALYECIDRPGTGKEQTTRLETTSSLAPKPQGCTEVARIDCPRCGSVSLESARFCKSCGQRLIQDLQFVEEVPQKQTRIAALLLLLMIIILSCGSYWYFALRPTSHIGITAAAASVNRLKVTVEKVVVEKARWVPVPENVQFTNGDQIRIVIKPMVPSFIYALYRGTSATDAQLLYPDDQSSDKRCPQGATVIIPRQASLKAAKGMMAFEGLRVSGPPGSEVIIFLASSTKLDLLSQPSKVKAAFQLAINMLESNFCPNGLEVSTQDFVNRVFSKQLGLKDGAIYVNQIKITHGN